jgi:hypothetical protein
VGTGSGPGGRRDRRSPGARGSGEALSLQSPPRPRQPTSESLLGLGRDFRNRPR